MITWDELNEIINYNPDTGIFTWAKTRNSMCKEGEIAGGSTSNGYTTITINKQAYLAHRLAWFYCFKEWPEKGIDHINRIRNDNRIDNLREADQTLNNLNASIRKDNTTGYKGVYNHGAHYRARVHFNKKVVNLGTFKTAELANDAVLAFKKEHGLL